jgi:hypothetical protein
MYRVPDGTPLPQWARIFGNANQGHPDYPKVKRMAQILAEAVNQLLPQGYETREERGEIALWRQGKIEGGIGVAASYFYSPADDGFHESSERPGDDEFVRGCAEALMDRVQDWITADLTWPWPTVEGRRTVMPDYHVELEACVLRIWYAVEGAPVTRVVEIALPDWTSLRRGAV